MPKYFFDLSDGRGCLYRTGAFFNSDQAAKQEALLRAFNGTGLQLQSYNGARSIILRKETGEAIHEVNGASPYRHGCSRHDRTRRPT